MLNRAELIGRLGRDPDVRYTQEGKAIANLALATTDAFKDLASGRKKEHTEWHRVVLFGRGNDDARIALRIRAFRQSGFLLYPL